MIPKTLRVKLASVAFAASLSASAMASTLGVPGEHETIQAAINAAQAGDVVLVSPDTYKERIHLKPGVTLKSGGDQAQGKLGLKRAEVTIVDGSFEGAEGPGVAMAEGSTIDGFTVTGVGKYDDAVWKKHYATHGANQSHEHIGVPGTPGIAVVGVSRCMIRNNRCYENTLAGIGCQDKSQPTIIGNRCYRNKQSGIGSRSGARPLISGNECYENERAGIGQRGDAQTTLIDNANVAVGIHSGWKVNLSGNELSRDGGLPPIVMVLYGAEATFINNNIRGEGVAGIRVSGTVTAIRYRFEGTSLRKVGPPNFAIWALEGSQVTMSHNQVSTWRHALIATAAAITADNNTVSNFFRAALVVKQPSRSSDVFGNVAISNNPQDKVVSIDGAAGVVQDNQLRREP